jgi:hypothetical protein
MQACTEKEYHHNILHLFQILKYYEEKKNAIPFCPNSGSMSNCRETTIMVSILSWKQSRITNEFPEVVIWSTINPW